MLRSWRSDNTGKWLRLSCSTPHRFSQIRTEFFFKNTYLDSVPTELLFFVFLFYFYTDIVPTEQLRNEMGGVFASE